MSTTNEWIATAEEQWGEAHDGIADHAGWEDGLRVAEVAAAIAQARETARLADAQERVATAVEALAIFRAGDELMTSQATEVQALDMYRAGVALITGDTR